MGTGRRLIVRLERSNYPQGSKKVNQEEIEKGQHSRIPQAPQETVVTCHSMEHTGMVGLEKQEPRKTPRRLGVLEKEENPTHRAKHQEDCFERLNYSRTKFLFCPSLILLTQ